MISYILNELKVLDRKQANLSKYCILFEAGLIFLITGSLNKISILEQELNKLKRDVKILKDEKGEH